jgi:hypothetical protein
VNRHRSAAAVAAEEVAAALVPAVAALGPVAAALREPGRPVDLPVAALGRRGIEPHL